MRIRSRRIALWPLVFAAFVACDTLTARRIASDAASLYAKGEYEAAAKKYEQAIAIDPSISRLHLNLGFSYLQLLRTGSSTRREELGKKAIAALVAYRDRAPNDPRARDYLLQTFGDTLLYEEARRFLAPEIERDPPSLEAITVLGQIAAKLGRLDEAIGWCEKRALVSPTDPAGHQCLGSLLWSHLHKHPDVVGAERLALADRGLDALEKAIALAPEIPDPYTFVNLIHRERALGHPCGEGFDGGFDDRGRVADAGVDEKACEAAKAEDLRMAAEYQAKAKERVAAHRDGGSEDR
jgi:tetratricopeptide (TPR) repeat protein